MAFAGHLTGGQPRIQRCDDLLLDLRPHDLGVEQLQHDRPDTIEERLHGGGHRALEVFLDLRGEVLRVAPQHRHPGLVDRRRPPGLDLLEAFVEDRERGLTGEGEVAAEVLLPLPRVVLQFLEAVAFGGQLRQRGTGILRDRDVGGVLRVDLPQPLERRAQPVHRRQRGTEVEAGPDLRPQLRDPGRPLAGLPAGRIGVIGRGERPQRRHPDDRDLPAQMLLEQAAVLGGDRLPPP